MTNVVGQATGSHVAPPGGMRRVAIASLMGTTIEFYDFFIFGTAAALVFSKVFFPGLGTAAGTAASFATFGVAFIARPFGAVLFGHFGDRIGRKRTLVTTLLMMGLATVMIGLLPTAATIGAAAPILLITLRIFQGLAMGGEWAGAVLLTTEHAPPGQRGRYSMFPQLGPSLAFGLTSTTFLITALTMSEEAFLAYGWRIPFVSSFVLVAIGFYMRLKIEETPVFKDATHQRKLVGNPLVAVTRKQPREVLLAGGALTSMFAFFYIGGTYLMSYGTGQLQLDRTTVLMIGIPVSLFFMLTTAVAGIQSDRFGRRKVIIGGNIAGVLIGLVLFPLVDIGTPLAFGIGMALMLGIVGVALGPTGAYLPEIFATEYRYTGAGMGYNLAGIFGGALAPMLAASLASSYGGYAIGLMLSVTAILSLVCVLALKETRGQALKSDGRQVVRAAT